MAQSYATPQEAVDAVRPGYTIVGVAQNIEEVPNPQFDKAKPIDAALNPQFIKKVNGSVLSLQGPDGKPDRMVISDAKVGGPGKGGVGYEVLTGPTQTPTATASAVSDLQRLDANYNVTTDPKATVYIRDPKSPPGTQPYKLEGDAQAMGDPSTWTIITANPTDPASRPIGLFDPKSQKVAATLPAAAGTQNTDPSKWTPVYRTPGDASSGIVGQFDPANNELHAVSAAPDGSQIVTTTNAIYVVDKDTGKSTKVQDIEPNTPAQAVTLGDTVYAFDPKTKTFTKGPTSETPATVGISAGNEYYVFFDKQGNEISRSKNPNYKGPDQTTAPPTSLSAPTIPRWNPQKGAWEDVPNTGRLTIGDVTQNLITELTGQTVDPNHPMSLEEAQTVLTNAINKMTAEAQKDTAARGAAGDILTAQSAGAQTGAGMLQERQRTATNLVQQGLGVATSTGGRYGNYSGGILSPMPGFGQALVQGAAGYATELGGGQAVYDTAARMVQAADPNNSNPDRASAMAALTQMLDKYQQASGQLHPAVAATQAATQSAATNTFVPPNLVPPEVFQAQFDPRFNPASPQQPQGTVLPPGVAGTVAPSDPRYLGTQPRSAAQLGFQAPPTAINNLGNIDPRLRGAIY